jgi:predicted N-formylglutamate amidohydrolase
VRCVARPADARLTDAVVVTCEHGGNRVPKAYRPLFGGLGPMLQTHRGYDAGALRMASAFAAALEAPLFASTVSRLLVDLNRSLGHPRLHHEVVMRMGASARQQIIDRFYAPYRGRIERWVAAEIAAGQRVVHLSSHSFTPELDGKERLADVGLLYDPRRPEEAAFCALWKAALCSAAPDLRVRRNYPYAGKNDGLTSMLRKRFPARAYIGIELEVNQAQVFGRPRQWARLRATLIESFRRSFNAPRHVST